MSTRLILTLPLILLAAILALVGIALLLMPRPEPAERPRQASAPTLTFIAKTITDTRTDQPLRADVYINGALLYQGVTQFKVMVPMDGSAEIRVVALGYKLWGGRPRAFLHSSKMLVAPIELTPEK